MSVATLSAPPLRLFVKPGPELGLVEAGRLLRLLAPAYLVARWRRNRAVLVEETGTENGPETGTELSEKSERQVDWKRTWCHCLVS